MNNYWVVVEINDSPSNLNNELLTEYQVNTSRVRINKLFNPVSFDYEAPLIPGIRKDFVFPVLNKPLPDVRLIGIYNNIESAKLVHLSHPRRIILGPTNIN